MNTTTQDSLPELLFIEQEIERANLLDSIDSIFQSQSNLIDIISISGPSGIGKTTLLRQFGKRHHSYSVSISIRTQSRWAYDAQCVMHQIAEQINDFLNQSVAADARFTIADLRDLYLALQRKVKRSGRAFYFIVDGLEDIPASEADCRQEIWSLLPFGIPGIRFLLSINPSDACRTVGQNLRLKELIIPGLSVDETARFFRDLNLSERQIEDIRRTCHGSPGMMASIRRSARNTANLDMFIQNLPQSLPGIFELEWDIVKDLPDQAVDCLAIIAYDRKSYTVSDLAAIADMDIKELKECLIRVQFIELGEHAQVEYVSESFKQFAANQLRHKYRATHEKIISYLLRNPSSDDALFEVPRLLSDIGKMEDLLKLLTAPGHFTLLLERSDSISMVRQKTELGIKAASQLYRDDDLARFGIQLASTRMLSSADEWRNEIESRLALDDIQGARKLAQLALVRETRFHMLVVIAKVMYQQNRTMDEELLAQISQLYQSIDFAEMGDKSFEIASDLVFVRPELAMEIVECASKRKAAKPESFDWALARLSLEAESQPGAVQNSRSYSVANSIQSKITDPVAQQFSRAASMLLGQYSADEVWAEASRITNPGNRVNFLRLWVVSNRKKPEAAKMAEQALQLAIVTTSYSLTASVLRDLATPLNSVQDDGTRQRLLSIFDAQRIAAEQIGPTEDYFDFWLLLTKARARLDHKQSLSDLIDIFYKISYITELSTKAACMARLMALLPIIDSEKKLESSDRLHSTVEKEFVDLVAVLLAASADHIVATCSILRALSRKKPDLALQISSQLNSPIRRDEAKLIVVRAICAGELDDATVQTCLAIIGQINIGEFTDAAYDALIRAIFERNDATLSLNCTKQVAMLADCVKSPYSSCQLASIAYSFLKKKQSSEFSSIISHLQALLTESLRRIDPAWLRVDAGFEVAKRVASVDRELAQEIIMQADSLRREHLLGSEGTATAFYWCLKLIVVSYSGLFQKRLDTELDERALASLVGRIPGRSVQVVIWADVSFRYYLSHRREDCVRISTKYVRPIVDDLLASGDLSAYHVISQCMPSIYLASQLGAVELLNKLPYPHNDHAIGHIKDAILHRVSPFDVAEYNESRTEIVQVDEVIELLKFMQLATADHLAFSIIDGITDAITSKKNRERFSRQQLLEIARRIEEYAAINFPKREFVCHAGWKVLAMACVAKIKNVDAPTWQELMSQARQISNVADRVLVLDVLATKLPSRLQQLRTVLVEEACKDAQAIPVAVDRISRLRAIAQDCTTSEPAIARRCVTDAMKLAINVDDEDNFASNERRRLVDLAYKMDPKLAEEVADLGDDDPARLRARHQMTQEIAVLNRKRQIIDDNSLTDRNDSTTQAQNLEANWRTLAALNGGKIRPFTKEQVREHLRCGAALSLEDSFPLFLLAVSSLVRRYAGTPEASSYLRPMFDGLVRSAEVAWRIISRTVGATPLLAIDAMSTDSSSIVIGPGEREQALIFIEKWVAENVTDNLVICDPYFGPEELEIIARIQGVVPACEVRILTSLKHQQQTHGAASLPDRYASYWKFHISDADPPSTEIYIFQSEIDNRSPLHDRWMLTESSGLSIGTSFNSLGTNHCAIDQLSSSAVRVRSAEVTKLLSKQARTSSGQRVKCQSFSL